MTDETAEKPSPRTYTLSTVLTVAFFALGLGLGAGFAVGRVPRTMEERLPTVAPSSTDQAEEPTPGDAPGPQ